MSTTIPQRQSHTRPPDIRSELERLFGFSEFRGKQEAVVAQVMAGVDTIAVMPTGAGKSLCYQLPAMLLPGMTLVISPLIALMKDQYDWLPAEVYERSTFINSSLEVEALTGGMERELAGKNKLVYAAPERLRQQPFVHALRRANVSLLVVDEAHCVSHVGARFPARLPVPGQVPASAGRAAVLALTATATPEMREEIGAPAGQAAAARGSEPLPPQPVSTRWRRWPTKKEVAQADRDLPRGERLGHHLCPQPDASEEIAAVLRRSG